MLKLDFLQPGVPSETNGDLDYFVGAGAIWGHHQSPMPMLKRLLLWCAANSSPMAALELVEQQIAKGVPATGCCKGEICALRVPLWRRTLAPWIYWSSNNTNLVISGSLFGSFLIF